MKRTIAAIVAADVAGYSRLIAQDEEDTLARLADHGAVFRDYVSRFEGRVFNTAGDAILAEFPSAVEALRAAIAIQKSLIDSNRDYPPERRVEFRIGITIGDVVERDGDLLGDGVNIAARLEGLAEPGGICISRSIHEAVANKVPAVFREIGPQNLKNIPRPVHAFQVVIGADGPRPGVAVKRRKRLVLAGVLAALGVAVSGVVWRALPTKRTPAGPDIALSGSETAERAAYLTVSVTRPQQTCFQDHVRVSGVLGPRREVEVRPESDGLRVVRVLAEPPDQVSAGQILAQLARQDDSERALIAVRSPVAGTIGRSTASVGEAVSPASEPLFQIAEQGEIELVANVPVTELRKLAPGQVVSVTPLGMAALPGRIRVVSAGGESATQLGRVRVDLEDDPLRVNGLRWGTFARGIVSRGGRCGVAIPFASLSTGPDGASVFVATHDRIEARPVTTGLSAGDIVEIRSGIAESDLVVVKAGAFLREGDLIRPVVAGDLRLAN